MHVPTAALSVLLALAVAPASAQPPAPLADAAASAADSTQADSTLADPAQADSTAAPRLTGLLRRVATEAQEQQEARGRLAQAALERASRPTRHVFSSGLNVTLPPGWDGPTTALDQGPPRERYTFQNAAPGHPLAGAILRVERVGGLNPLEREQWVRGQTTYGYNGTRPVGPASAPAAGLALEVEGAGQAGAVVFAHHRGEMWALQVVAPTALWRARRAEVLAVLAGVALP